MCLCLGVGWEECLSHVIWILLFTQWHRLLCSLQDWETLNSLLSVCCRSPFRWFFGNSKGSRLPFCVVGSHQRLLSHLLSSSHIQYFFIVSFCHLRRFDSCVRYSFCDHDGVLCLSLSSRCFSFLPSISLSFCIVYLSRSRFLFPLCIYFVILPLVCPLVLLASLSTSHLSPQPVILYVWDSLLMFSCFASFSPSSLCSVQHVVCSFAKGTLSSLHLHFCISFASAMLSIGLMTEEKGECDNRQRDENRGREGEKTEREREMAQRDWESSDIMAAIFSPVAIPLHPVFLQFHTQTPRLLKATARFGWIVGMFWCWGAPVIFLVIQNRVHTLFDNVMSYTAHDVCMCVRAATQAGRSNYHGQHSVWTHSCVAQLRVKWHLSCLVGSWRSEW